jgi:hypothetical protein
MSCLDDAEHGLADSAVRASPARHSRSVTDPIPSEAVVDQRLRTLILVALDPLAAGGRRHPAVRSEEVVQPVPRPD